MRRLIWLRGRTRHTTWYISHMLAHVIFLHVCMCPYSSLLFLSIYFSHQPYFACMHDHSLAFSLSIYSDNFYIWNMLCFMLARSLLIIPSHHFLSLYILTTHMCCSMFFFMHVLIFEVYFFSIYSWQHICLEYVPVDFTDTVVRACPLAVSHAALALECFLSFYFPIFSPYLYFSFLILIL